MKKVFLIIIFCALTACGSNTEDVAARFLEENVDLNVVDRNIVISFVGEKPSFIIDPKEEKINFYYEDEDFIFDYDVIENEVRITKSKSEICKFSIDAEINCDLDDTKKQKLEELIKGIRMYRNNVIVISNEELIKWAGSIDEKNIEELKEKAHASKNSTDLKYFNKAVIDSFEEFYQEFYVNDYDFDKFTNYIFNNNHSALREGDNVKIKNIDIENIDMIIYPEEEKVRVTLNSNLENGYYNKEYPSTIERLYIDDELMCQYKLQDDDIDVDSIGSNYSTCIKTRDLYIDDVNGFYNDFIEKYLLDNSLDFNFVSKWATHFISN